jgi:hypothetical protein
MLDSRRFKNFRQPEDRPRLCREIIYFATVLAEAVKPQSREFGLDPPLTPKSTCCGHPSDERGRHSSPAADVTATISEHSSLDDATSTPSRALQ